MKRMVVLLLSAALVLSLGVCAAAAVQPALSGEAWAVSALTVVDPKASALLTDGAKRYIDMDAPAQTPVLVHGILYLPVHTLARALGYYYEEGPGKSEYLLRKGKAEFFLSQAVSYVRMGTEEKREIPNQLIYRNGEAMLPLRYFAEAGGDTVTFQDGLAVIGAAGAVETAVGNRNIVAYMKAQLAPFYPAPAAGKTYHVSQAQNASDVNPGTEALPWRTLSKAAAAAGPGDRVVIHQGVYRELFQPKRDGSPTAPVIFQAAEGEAVTVSAAEELTGFVPLPGIGLAQAALPADLGAGRNQVFYQEEALAEARYPNGPAIPVSGEGLSSLFPIAGDFQGDPDNKNSVTSGTLLDQPEGYWNGAGYIGMQGAGWALGSAKVERSVNGRLYLKDQSKQWWFDASAEDKWRFGYLTGHINCVDQPGEWVVRDGMLCIQPPEGETAQSLKVEVKQRQVAVDLSGRSYVQVKGIRTFGGGVRMNDSVMCVIDGAQMNYISHYTYGDDQREGFIDSVDVSDKNGAPPRGEMGVYIGGENNAIVNSVIDHSAAAGIYSVGTYAYIENNIIKNCGYMGGYVSGITFGSEGWKPQNTPRGGFSLYHNTVYNCGRSALNMQGRQYWPGSDSDTPYLHFEAAYNDFHDGILFSLDTGVVYEYYVQCGWGEQSSSFHHNYVYFTGEQSNPYSFGIYHDGTTGGIDTYGNVIFTVKPGVRFTNGMIYKQPTADCKVWNNGLLKAPVPEGRNGLLYTDFPDEQPYFAGSALEREDYAAYEDRFIKQREAPKRYFFRDAGGSNNVQTEEDGVTIGRGGWVRLDDVEFGTGANSVKIAFTGDPDSTGDLISVIAGGDLESGKVYNAYLNYGAPGGETDSVCVEVGGFTGKQAVYVRVESYRSAKFQYLTVNGRGTMREAHDGSRVYGGEFNNVDRAGQRAMPPTPVYFAAGDTEHPIVKNTYGGTVLRYDQVKVEETAVMLRICASSEGDASGGTVQVRVGSRTADPVGEYTMASSGWNSYLPVDIPLSQPLGAGTYDIYLTFTGSGKTCNLYYFGFLSD